MNPPATRLLAHLSFWLATLAMLGMGSTLYDAVTSEVESSRQVSRTQEIRQAAGEINELLSRAESAQRGFLLSGRSTFLAERDPAIDNLNDAVAHVKALTSLDPGQQRRVTEIGKLVEVRIARMQDGARPPSVGRIESAQSGIGQAGSTRIRELVAEVRQEELRRMKILRTDADNRHETELWVLVAAVTFGIIALIPGYLGFVLQTRARERTEKKLRVMADSLPCAMYQLTHPVRGKANFTFMSSGFTNVMGMPAAGPADAAPDWDAAVAAIDERDRPGFVAALDTARRLLTPFRHDYRVTHGDGTSRWLHHEASLKREDDGSVLQNGYLSDITEQRRLEEALQDAKIAADSANRAKSAFLATMSHEIRTPMNGVLGMLELLSLTRLDASQRGTLEIVRDSSRSLMRIIDDILDFSKIEAGKLEVLPEVASIRQVIEGVRNIYSGNASSNGLLLTCGTDPNISPAVMVDPLRLRQILSNFVSNALKFTRQGSIAIRADLVERANGEDRVRFSVQDTGIGISAPNQDRLFQPFSQGDGAIARGAGGTGLGLAICRRLADMMGGTVEMASVPGEGTTMTLALSLPIVDPEGLPEVQRENAVDPMRAAARRPAPAVAQAESEGTLVLVVDDHPTNRALLLRQVQALGYAGESVEDGVQALDKWKSGRFGIVITDCNMPEMDGYELARSIRALEAGGDRRTPILACTAYALGGEAEICLAAGMDDYLGKPVGLAQLLKKLDHWLPIPVPVATGSAPCGPPPDTATDDGPVDRSVLAAISNGDRAFEQEILTRFRQSSVEDAAMLEQAVVANDVAQVTRASHRMLGASRMVGALGLAGACERIGQGIRIREWGTVESGLGTFRLELARLNAYFDTPERSQ